MRRGASSETSGRIRQSAYSVLLWAALLVAMSLVVMDTGQRIAMVEKISAISLTEVAPHSLPIPEGSREEHLLLPGSSMDTRWWVLHTREMMEEGGFRWRSTDLDNVPSGREVHWSSLLMWLLAGVAFVLSIGSGRPATDFVAEAALWAGPIGLLLFLCVFVAILLKRFGTSAAGFFCLVFLSAFPLLRMFQAGDADHHGLVVSFLAAGILCLLAGGLGAVALRRPASQSGSPFVAPSEKDAARWFCLAGVFGAAGLWISAATAIPVLAGAGIGSCLSAWAFRRSQGTGEYRADLWRKWAVAGFIASLFFYALEYLPGNAGWRLEVNHPLFAFAWLGAGLLLEPITRWIATGNPPSNDAGSIIKIAVALLLVLAPPAVVLLFREHVFWVSDTFLLALHDRYIMEFQSLPDLFRAFGGNWAFLTYYPWPAFVVLAVCLVGFSSSWSPSAKRYLAFLLPPLLLMQTLAVYQVRWSSAAFAIWAVLALVLYLDSSAATSRWQAAVRWLALATSWVAIFVTLIPHALATIQEQQTCTDAPLKKEVGNGVVLKDIAHRLLHSSPDVIPVVLTGPNASTDLAYHGKIKGLGTLYWENMPGLKHAAELFSLSSEQETFERLQAAGVTHIVVPSWDDFSKAYRELWQLEMPETAAEDSYLDAVFRGEENPQWLRPFAYPIPTDSGIDATSVKIFAVLPTQNEFEYWFFRGVYHWESGEPERAKEMFLQAAQLRPTEPRVKSYLEAMEASMPTAEQEGAE